MPDNNDLQETQNRVQERKNSFARNVGEKVIKKAGKHGSKNVVTQKAISVLLQFAPVIGYVLIALVIIFILVGLIAFLLTMPGLMADKLKQFGENVTKSFKSIFMKDAEALVSDSDIIDLANYIKEMDYDIIGYGFVKPSKEKSYPIAEELVDQGYERITETEEDADGNTITKVYYRKPTGEQFNDRFFDRDGMVYYGATGEKLESKGEYTKYGITYDEEDKITSLKGLDTSILKTYAIADRSIYILRNDDDGFFSRLFNTISSFVSGKDYNSWANGLVRIYESKNSIATNEYLKGIFNAGTWFDAIEYTSDNKLKIKKGLFNNAMLYDTDGWSGRYGLSKDFLISLHLATLSPDFVQTVVQSFDTEVQVYLDEIKGADAEVRMIDTSSSVIGTEETALQIGDFTDRFEKIGLDIDDQGLDIDSWWVSKKEAARFYWYTKMASPSTCTYSYKGGLPDRVFPWDEGAGDIANWRIDDYEEYYKNNIDSNIDAISNDSSYYISRILEDFVDRLANSSNNFGFDKEEFYKKVKLKDGDKCSTDKLIKNLNVNEDLGHSDSYKKILLPKKDVYDRLNNDFFKNNGYNDLEKFVLGEYADDEPRYFFPMNADEQKEYKDKITILNNEVLADNINSNALTTDIDLGETCAFENGRFISEIDYGQSGATITYPEASERLNCDCQFCETFWKKYLWMEMGDFSEFDSYAIENDIKEIEENNIDSSEKFWESVIDLYSWEHELNGELLKYSISFYHKDNGNVQIVLNRCWTEEENISAMEQMENTDTCSKKIQECKDEDEAKKVKVCSKCKRYVKHIVWSLKKINDPNFSTAVPYIARVVNSWFRDTFFIIPKYSHGDAAIKDAMDEYDYKASELTGTGIKVIQNDDEFLEGTGELWTEYIMDRDGDYARFIIDTTGELIQKDGLDDYIDKLKSGSYAHDALTQDDEDKLRDLIQEEYTYVTKDSRRITAYARWLGDEEDESANKLIEKYNIGLVKIPVTKEISTLSNSEIENSNIAWSAYSRFVSDDTVWQNVDINNDSPYYMRNVARYYSGTIRKDANTLENGELIFQVGLTGVFNMEQEQDAQRGMTNAKIKYLFKNKKYYKYDGTIPRAFQIDEDWKKCIEIMPVKNAYITDPKSVANSATKVVLKNLFRPKLFSFWWAVDKAKDDIKAEANQLKETALNSYIDLIYYQDDKGVEELKAELLTNKTFLFARDFNNDNIADIASLNLRDKTSYDGLQFDENTKFTNDPRNPNLISKIDLSSDGLAAFSILENTHTADADYAYRDLKELVVELEYFDKEDLTEPATDILEWILPESGSYGWPVRRFDKINNFGTIIHSKEMYDNFDLLFGTTDGEIVDYSSIISVYTSLLSVYDAELEEIEKETPINNKRKLEVLNFKLETYNELINKIEKANGQVGIEESQKTEFEKQIKEYEKQIEIIEKQIEEIPEPEKEDETNVKNDDFSNNIDSNSSNTEENTDSTSEDSDEQALLNKSIKSPQNSLIASRTETGTTSNSKVEYTETSDPNMHCESTTTINGVEYRNYKQGYAEWGSIPYSQGTMATSACGATSTAVILSGYGNDLTPKDTAEWIKSNKPGAETNADSLRACLAHYGVESEVDYSSSHQDILEKIKKAWSEGKPVIANVGVGQMTSYGHYIVILGESDGKVVISQVGGSNYNYIENGHLYIGNGNNNDLSGLDAKNYIKGVIIPTKAPKGEKKSTAKAFEGFSNGDAIVSPATAKIIEMGTTTVTNENTEQIFNSLYVVRDEYTETNENDNNSDSQSDDSDNSAQKVFVTESEKEDIEIKGKTLYATPDNSFGKSYTTGYVKLEVIGAETIVKLLGDKKNNIEPVIDLPIETRQGLEAFYEDYYNKPQGKTICDSYTIYIEGIDFRLDQSEGASWDLENTILNEIIKTEKDNKDNNGKEKSEENGQENSEQNTEDDGKKITYINSDGEEIEKTIDNYTPKEIPKYYTKKKRGEMNTKEEHKKKMPSIIDFYTSNKSGTNERQIYVKAGTLLGVCSNANIKIVMKDKDYSVVENVEEYMEIDDYLTESKNNDRIAGSSASEYYLAWHICTYGQMAIPACGVWYDNYGDTVNGERVEYTNNDTGIVPNLMPELAMHIDGPNVKHLSELGYDPNKLSSFSYIGKSGKNPVKLDDVLDTYYLYINNAADDIKNKVNRDLKQYELDALIETYIWGVGYTNQLIDILNSKGSLSVDDFRNISTYLTKDRQEIAGRLFNTDTSKYPNGYFSKEGDTQHLEFKCDSPFSTMVFDDAMQDEVMEWVN